jgi:D-alanine-D-alanine ligase
MASATRKLPADIPESVRDEIRGLATRAFRALRCSGVARIDFLMDGETGELWVNEINTIPGSLAYYLWRPLGMEYPELLDRLVSLALKREREGAAISYSFDTDILKNFSGEGLKGARSGGVK